MTSTDPLGQRMLDQGLLAADFAKFLVKHVVIRRGGELLRGLTVEAAR